MVGAALWGLGWAWVAVSAFMSVFSIGLTFYALPFWDALARVQFMYDPFSVASFLARVVEFGPGVALLWLAGLVRKAP